MKKIRCCMCRKYFKPWEDERGLHDTLCQPCIKPAQAQLRQSAINVLVWERKKHETHKA